MIESETIKSLLNWKNEKNHSDSYSQWIKDTKQKELTGSQIDFAHFLFENKDKLMQIGDLETIFINVRKWLKQ